MRQAGRYTSPNELVKRFWRLLSDKSSETNEAFLKQQLNMDPNTVIRRHISGVNEKIKA